MFSALVTLLLLTAASLAAVVDVKVGDGGLTFAPEEIVANVGDVVLFHFYSGHGSHSVAPSTFEAPCVPVSADSFYSGTVQGDSTGDQTFAINITSTNPVWIYCAVGQHCQAGMGAVINTPSNTSETVALYQAAAKGVDGSRAPASVQGGVLVSGSASSSGVANSSSGVTSSAESTAISTLMESPTSTTLAATATSTSTSTPTMAGSSTPARTSSAVASTTAGSGAGRRHTNEWAVVVALGGFLVGTVSSMA
ncbi:hypothetical protein BUE80_DR009080 [Diplocarpon rosae]|nr:hypothetical protein BUE80_DR009080 [Diplocarpon rosae]